MGKEKSERLKKKCGYRDFKSKQFISDKSMKLTFFLMNCALCTLTKLVIFFIA